MKQLSRCLGFCVLAWAASTGCGGSSADGARLGGETNWLGSCRDDGDCNVGQCLCGVCTLSCESADACSAGPPDASCVSVSELPSSCGAELRSTGICLGSSQTALQATGNNLLLDSALELLVHDLEYNVPTQDQRYLRYVSIANQHEIGSLLESEVPILSESALERASYGLQKTMSSLSWLPARRLFNGRLSSGTSPEGDPYGVLLRVDLREYGLDSPITVDGVQYADAWDAIVANAALAVEYEGPAADRLKELSGARVPLLFEDDFITGAVHGNTYYGILGLPETLDGLRAQLEAGSSSANSSALRAAFETSGVSYNTRVLERRELEPGSGRGYWQAFDFLADHQGAAVYLDPLGFVADATEVMFTLPNGMYGFYLADAAGRRVSESALSPETVTDPAQPDWVTRNAGSCFSCHNAGLITFTDNLRGFWTPAPPVGFASEQQGVLDTYPEQWVLDKVMEREDGAYRDTLTGAGMTPGAPDPISRLSLTFREVPVGLGRAAAELMAMPGALRRRLSQLPEVLGALETDYAEVPRDEFFAVYRQALCTLHESSQNHPLGCL